MKLLIYIYFFLMNKVNFEIIIIFQMSVAVHRYYTEFKEK